ncbi:atrial natriuretic peptide receptor 1 isoform X2 [Eupeodes corollae]|uniref:atrial natriuretic peptide receptor 1 isoform X2 n=1 Tax=Eupeodes corollae TaxID=290404 RepID=UPI002491465F|nr:atrial natriuretic peptide receptor 1 isoform X2 [Eupeodes corollae]XP_055914135.1 atrial natriuretic peptide receptor 1 isoform X2 [Eupeodes corollae]XP_055914145.1 atrial natriuretic peptide receptor 1 isoform X2 [Eupeodes corollae]XP_055914153.1 atrial natriuretic peptide receptor 1 isoform X2 [Eupeodes corollae]
MGLNQILGIIVLIIAASLPLHESVTVTVPASASVFEERTKSSNTEVIQIFNASDFSSDPRVLRRNLTFTVLLTAKEAENQNDCIMPKVMPALELAIRDVQRLGFPGVNFDVTLISRDTFCSSTYGAIGFFEIYSRWHDINAVFGLSCDYVLAPISRYSGVWEIPVLSTAGRSRSFDLKEGQYPTLTRLMGGLTAAVGNDTKGMLEVFNWTRAALMYQNTDTLTSGNSICFFCMSTLHSKLGKSSVYQVGFDERAFHKANITMQLQIIARHSRIVIMCADPKSIRQILLTADELNMIDSGEYVFINIELFSRVPHVLSQPWYDENDTDENNARARNAYTALLTVTPKQPDNEDYIRVSNEIKSIAAAKYNYTFRDNEPLSTFVTSFYDGVLLYAHALNESIREDPSVLLRPINGTDMVRRMWNRSFPGITGNVTIDSNGDRISGYSLLDMNPVTGRFEIVAHFMYNRLEFVEGKVIHWAADRLEPPPDKPECGYDGSLCPDNSLPGYAILSTVLGFLVLIMIVFFVLGYRHYKSEAEINSMTWRVSIDDVLWHESGGRCFRGSFHSLVKQNSQMTLMSEDMGSLCGDRQIFIPVGTYKGCRVAIKRIDGMTENLSRSLMLELKRMKDLQHDHLVKFFGACLDPRRSFILTEYAPKGSLRDILEDDQQYQLDLMFKMSLMHDIIRGMHFLHSSDIKSHGNLKSSNCVVDSRFVLKITDFGLHSLMRKPIDNDEENCNHYAYWSNLLWTAPELLRLEKRPPEGTQKGDVYSFGIIVHEITTRQGPFYLGEMADKSPQEIIQLVKAHPSEFSKPFRPHISDNKHEDMNNLMVRCWQEDPYERPDFGALKSTIRKINKDNETGNIVDNLLKRMEQYANNLEELVDERTKDYHEEKKKCEKLLYQLLPQSVAAQLISGQPVVAETFDQVTIYFSDIVGFTAISAESTPMQVVQFLNDLYTCFDSIVENFDVYKVETIGDAYMVVSGLPLRNGNQHSREIARLALALLDEVHKFRIHHRPDDRLRLRIGLHTGACVAGVVGLKMPRYCLFGDTVNTASRMESNGEALKIHISHTTKTCLDEFGTFITRERGLVNMKGKGEMLTYWLEGEEPSDDSCSELAPHKKQLLSSISNFPPPYTSSSPASSLRKHRKMSSSSPKLNGCGAIDSMKTDEQNSLIDFTLFDRGGGVNGNCDDRLYPDHQNGNTSDIALWDMSNPKGLKPKNSHNRNSSPRNELFHSSTLSPYSNSNMMVRRNSTKTAADIARAAEQSNRYNHHNSSSRTSSRSNLNLIKASNSNNSLSHNNIVKANNVRNMKHICNPNEIEGIKNGSGGTGGVTQPLLTKINT